MNEFETVDNLVLSEMLASFISRFAICAECGGGGTVPKLGALCWTRVRCARCRGTGIMEKDQPTPDSERQ